MAVSAEADSELIMTPSIMITRVSKMYIEYITNVNNYTITNYTTAHYATDTKCEKSDIGNIFAV